ncbi:MAG TPA: ABC transporter permease [Opitutaceae bacterium]|nr:ABC transporter permease [Opitutaceae bacterium]
MKHAFRSLVRTPGFTLLVIVTLALGIGLNTAMFSMLNGFLLRPLTYPESGRLFRLDHQTPQRPFDNHAALNFADIARATADVAELAAVRYWGFTVTEPGQPPDTPLTARTTANYFSVLGLRPALGRTFLPEEEMFGKNNVVVISHRYWQERFGGTADIIGRTIRLDGTPVEIIGVIEPDPSTIRVLGPVAVYRPLGLNDQERTTRVDHNFIVTGRYRDGVTPEQARARFDAVARQLTADHPAEVGSMTLSLRSLQSTTLTGTGRYVTLVLVGLSSFVLLIACANLANLLLTRAIGRAREFSIRVALGATRGQLLGLLAQECLLLAVAGGGLACLVAAWTADWLSVRFGTPANPADFSTDLRVLGFTLAAAVLAAFFFGVAPAWWASRARFNETLKAGGRGSTGGPGHDRFRRGLIVVQFALSLVLLCGAGLFIRGLSRLVGQDNGWNPAPVISGTVNLASARYGASEPIIQFHAKLRELLLAQPGVANVAVGYTVPLFDSPSNRNYAVAGRPVPPQGEEIVAFTNGVSATFLDVTGMRLRRGRFIDETDQTASRPVVVINHAMAQALFGGDEPALGQRLVVAGQDPALAAEIVGVVDDVRALNIRPSPIRFQVYKPFTQEPWQYANIAIRVSDPALAGGLLGPIRRAAASIDPDQPVFRLMAIPERIEANFGIWETVKRLLVAFAGLGLILAAVGISGVVSQVVLQRTGEIGIRIALGAATHHILGLVLGGGLRTALAGVAVGAVGAVFFARFLTRVLPSLGGSALVPVATGGAVLLSVALLACWLPARRATRVDPVEAIRLE